MKSSSKLVKTGISSAAIIICGGWAYYSSLIGMDKTEIMVIAVRAGIIQGAYSGVLTLIQVVMLEYLFFRLNPYLSNTVNVAATFLLAMTVQYAIIIPIHLVNGSPNIILTLLPGFLIGAVFSLIYLVAIKEKFYSETERYE